MCYDRERRPRLRLGRSDVGRRPHPGPAARGVRAPRPGNSFVEIGRPACIGAGDDHHVFAAGVERGVQLADELVSSDELLVVEMAAPLGESLVFELDRSNSGTFIRAHGTHDMQGRAVASVRVGYDAPRPEHRRHRENGHQPHRAHPGRAASRHQRRTRPLRRADHRLRPAGHHPLLRREPRPESPSRTGPPWLRPSGLSPAARGSGR